MITDRLYRRIVPDDRIDEAIGTLARMLHLLRETKLAGVDWAAIGLSGPEEGPAGLATDATLRDFYLPFEDGLVDCASGMKFGATRGWTFPSVRLACLSIPQFMEYEQRPPKEYDELEGEPFWLRD